MGLSGNLTRASSQSKTNTSLATAGLVIQSCRWFRVAKSSIRSACQQGTGALTLFTSLWQIELNPVTGSAHTVGWTVSQSQAPKYLKKKQKHNCKH